MSNKTIRRNSLKVIDAALKECVLITSYRYDDMDTDTNKPAVSAADVLAMAGDFGSVSATYDADGVMKKIHITIHSNHFYNGYRTVEDARDSLTPSAFRKYFPEIAAQEQAEEEAKYQAAAVIENAANSARIESMTTDTKQPEIALNQFIFAKFASLNKNCNIGGYISECCKPEFKEKIWQRVRWVENPNWRVSRAKVSKIINMTAVDYDHFAVNLMESRNDLFADFEGGTGSDFDCGRDIKEFWEMSPAEQDEWRKGAYSLVALIQAPGRASFVVNPEGYDYARYVGLNPTL